MRYNNDGAKSVSVTISLNQNEDLNDVSFMNKNITNNHFGTQDFNLVSGYEQTIKELESKLKFQEIKLIEKDDKNRKLEEIAYNNRLKITRLEESLKIKNKELTNCYAKLDKMIETMEAATLKQEALKVENKKLKSDTN